jgi:glycine cleavage system H protein
VIHPDDLRYTADHEWVRTTPDGTVRIGITDHAQDALGDIVYVSLPEIGATVSEGDPVGEVESHKSVSEIYAPLGGVVTARNDELDDSPDAINEDPYGSGWILEIRPDSLAEVDALLDAETYLQQIASESG